MLGFDGRVRLSCKISMGESVRFARLRWESEVELQDFDGRVRSICKVLTEK